MLSSEVSSWINTWVACELTIAVGAAFESPDDFIPERWYSRPELIHDKRAFGPFSFGTLSLPDTILYGANIFKETASVLAKCWLTLNFGLCLQTC